MTRTFFTSLNLERAIILLLNPTIIIISWRRSWNSKENSSSLMSIFFLVWSWPWAWAQLCWPGCASLWPACPACGLTSDPRCPLSGSSSPPGSWHQAWGENTVRPHAFWILHELNRQILNGLFNERWYTTWWRRWGWRSCNRGRAPSPPAAASVCSLRPASWSVSGGSR